MTWTPHARVRGRPGRRSSASWLCFGLLALALSAARAFAGAETNSEKLQFDPETVARIGQIEQKRNSVVPPPEEPAPPISEGDRVRDGNAAIEDALRATGIQLKPAGARDIEREYREILASETKALGAEAEALEPEVDRDDYPELQPEPLPPVSRLVVHTAHVGIDRSDFQPTGASRITTDVMFGEYKLLYDSHPAPKSRVKFESSLFDSNVRRSGIAFGTLDYRFNHRYTGSFGGTAIVERWNDQLQANDSLLGSGFGTIVMHLPEQLDFSLGYTFLRRTLDLQTTDLLSTRTNRVDFRVEKRMQGGTARFGYVDNQLDIPDGRSGEFSHSIVIAGYTAPILKKVDVDYAYVRQKEKRNFDIDLQGDFVQANNQINILWRFSHAMNLAFDIDTEDRNYLVPDTTFVSYRRTLMAPTFTVQQTPHLAYSLGYATEFWNHNALPDGQFFDARQNDYHTERYSAGLSYAKKKFSGVASVARAPTRYKVPGPVQSAFDTVTTAITLIYDFDADVRASASYQHVEQNFDQVPASNVSQNATADVSYKF